MRADPGDEAVARSARREWSAELLRAVVEARGELWITARGWSMWPTVRDGDEVLLLPIDRPRIGDVVVVDLGTRLVLHRIVRLDRSAIQTRGDASRESDIAPRGGGPVALAVAARRRGSVMRALRPTLRYGLPAFARWALGHGRFTAARGWRWLHPRITRLTP